MIDSHNSVEAKQYLVKAKYEPAATSLIGSSLPSVSDFSTLETKEIMMK